MTSRTTGMKKHISLSMASILILAHVCSAEDSLLSKRDGGTITGAVLNTKSQPIAGVVVILCEHRSGIPVCKGTFGLFTDAYLSKERNQQREICFSVTNDTGRFSFENIPAGEYRLVAQSWKGVQEIKSVFERNSTEIQLHGVAGYIRVSAGNVSHIELRPLGTGVLCLDEKAPNDETLLVISTSPTRADPILGFVGWGGAFMQNMIGGNRMLRGQTTVRGLPEGRIYIAMFAADSIPGWTEGQAEIKSNTTTVLEYIPFVNSWSNSRHDPPDHLLPVFEEMKLLMSRKDKFVVSLLQRLGIQMDSSKGMWGFMEQIGPRLDREVVLPSGGKARLGEVIAAVEYVQLQQTMERKREQWKKHDEAMKKFSDRQAVKKAEAQKEKVKIRDTVDVSQPLFFFPDDVQAGEELDETWAVKHHALNTLSSEEIFEIVRKGFRRTSADKNDIIRTIGSKYIWHMSPPELAAVDILYCASFDSDVMYNAFYYGLTVVKPKSPEVLKRLADLAIQGYGVGRTAWGVWAVHDQREEFISLLEPYLDSNDPTERQQAQNIIRVIEGKSRRVYDTGRGETKPEDIEKTMKDFGDKLDRVRQVLLTGASASRLAEFERISSLGIFHLFDDTFIPAIEACADDESPKVRIKTAEIAGHYWIWGNTIMNPKITQLLIRLSEDEVPDVRFAAVEKGLFNIPDKTRDVVRRIIDVALADQQQMPEKLYGRIERVVRTNREVAGGILQEYLLSDRSDKELSARLYRDALRLDPASIGKNAKGTSVPQRD